LKFEHDEEIKQKGPFCKGLKCLPATCCFYVR
jgi:hypothetical protein